MATQTETYPNTEILNTPHKHLVCFRSVIAGLFIAAFTYVLLTALGAGVGGLTASNFVRTEEGSAAGLATGLGLWLGLSAVISLFIGAYFAVRITKFTTRKAGVSNGMVLASIFMLLMVWGIGSGVGGVAKGLAQTALAASTTAASLSSNPMIQDTVQRAIGTSNLKSSPSEVAQGLTARLVQGNTDSAKSYLAYQTGQSEAEVDQKVAQMKTEFDQKAKIVAEKTADGVATAGWSLFVTLLLGMVSASIGGATAARKNLELPMTRFADEARTAGFSLGRPLANQNGDVLPYVLGWFLGVPISILFLIAMLRTVF